MSDTYHIEPIHKAELDHGIRNAGRILPSISGMGCQNWAAPDHKGLLSLERVHEAEVRLNMKMAGIFFDPKKVTTAAPVQAAAGAGSDGRHHFRALVITSQRTLIIR